MGENTSSSAQTLSIALRRVAAPTSLRYHRTNADSHLERGADVRVKGGSATVTAPGDTTFTLTGQAS